ncbi:mRNA interferase RelE/StbE [Haloechinothrix alba]|uniref:mRNA interferase RelE/StbE n=1 Tax=Haloechinothrix alba TaxID=664784 RepID=A0A238XSA2_9PSEU|nr:type II toxin-antitoxin system RelE/ParE family toxin [Haloechinothrix alba]SNR61875.1 mRNA interferase RelE/StbE [Haloechinothrix alba]
MTYRIELSRRAAKALDVLDKPVRRRAMAAIDALADNPRPHGCVKLSGTDNVWRIRVGAYRIIYEVHDQVLLIVVVDLGHRREIYR